jgi:hypothetical protein
MSMIQTSAPAATARPAGATGQVTAESVQPASLAGGLAAVPAGAPDQTTELLQQLFGYLDRNAESHAALIPAISLLRGAVAVHRPGTTSALGQAIVVYRYLVAAQASDPSLPVP